MWPSFSRVNYHRPQLLSPSEWLDGVECTVQGRGGCLGAWRPECVGEGDTAEVRELNLPKRVQFGSFAPPGLLSPVISLIPVHTSLALLRWALASCFPL